MADDPFATLARASFAGIEFPLLSCRMHGSSRNHVHIYAHVPGGDIEKLGRNLYEIEMRVPFLTSATAYPNLWPQRLSVLRDLFEAETTDWLVVPTVGRIKAYAVDWEQEMTGTVHNGEHATFKFMEDQSAAFLLEDLIAVNTKSVDSANDNFGVTLQRALQDQALPPKDRGLFDLIQQVANEIFAVKDQIDLAGTLVTEKIAMLMGLCLEADRTVAFLNQPANWPVLEALKELWDAARQLKQAVSAPQVAFAYYELPRPMTITEVSAAIFGTSDHAMDLLQLNAVDNAFDIPAGTRIRYLRSDVTASAA